MVIFFGVSRYGWFQETSETLDAKGSGDNPTNQVEYLEPNAENAAALLVELQAAMTRSEFLNSCKGAFVYAAATGLYTGTGKSAEDFFFDYVMRINRAASNEGIRLTDEKSAQFSQQLVRGATEEADRAWWACRSYVES